MACLSLSFYEKKNIKTTDRAEWTADISAEEFHSKPPKQIQYKARGDYVLQ